MKSISRITISTIFLLISFSSLLTAQVQPLDTFDSKDGWSFIRADGVNLDLKVDQGMTGSALRFDYDFTKGTGYGGIQKRIPIDLPENYEFTFWLRAESPANNFEIKFIDSTGNNVWWVNNRNYDFPSEWKKIRVRKRHIQFAWGPANDHDLKRIDRIEFTIASFVGGKGTIWLDDLRFEPLPPETGIYPLPLIAASTSAPGQTPDLIMDLSDKTYWKSMDGGVQTVTFDFKVNREYGGLKIDWLPGFYAVDYDILLSDDGKKWEKAYSVTGNRSDVSFIRMAESVSGFLRLEMKKRASASGFGIREITFPDVKSSLILNDFLIYAAKNSPVGDYPQYFREKASFWTIDGVNNDVKEALINESGMVEIEKGRASIEPMIRIGDSLYNWSNVNAVQTLGEPEGSREFSFLPSVIWQICDLKFTTGISSAGEANKNSILEIGYTFENQSKQAMNIGFYLLIRPLQVNPYYQFLNLTGGAGKIRKIREENGSIILDEDKFIIPVSKYDQFVASAFDEGSLVEMIRTRNLPAATEISDKQGMANGVMRYSLSLAPGERTTLFLVVPYYGDHTPEGKLNGQTVAGDYSAASGFWVKKTGHIRFNLPPSADPIVKSYRANLVYILLNRDHAGIQPGSRSYERSWIRDGALTSSALLKSGITQEVKDFIDWYSDHLYENGKVPCVVDFRGPDPVPENDSHGEYIYLVREYFNFTKDTTFLRSKNKHVLKAVDYMEKLIAEQTTDHYKYGNDSIRACYGLVTESISHEGYSAKPMHSYWDNFFTMKGLKDAAEIEKILGDEKNYERITRVRDTFRVNLYNSIRLAMQYHKIDYIPGCAELGDFDATSTTIALTPCNELKNLPKPQVYNTFDRYYDYFRKRRDNQIEWINYTPYENRLIGSFVLLDQPDRAHDLISFFLKDQHPRGWYHWAEVVWKDPATPKYIGDMPHTWVGSDFINAVRSMFVYENEYDQSLVLASALYQDWIDAPEGMSVENLPTCYGEISYSVKREGDHYRFSIRGDVKLPANGIKIKNFNGLKMPVKVTVNGIERKNFNNKVIAVKEIPAEVLIFY